MGEHDFRANIDKAQRDEMLEWLTLEIKVLEEQAGDLDKKPEHYVTDVLYLENIRQQHRILKSLKAMVENYPEQKTVTEKEIDELGKELSCSHNEEMWLIPLLHRRLKELGIPVLSFDTSGKQVEDSGDVRHIKVTDKEG